MKWQIWTVGKAHESYVKEGIEMFSRRLSNYYPVHWEIIPPPRNAASLQYDQLKEREGEKILSMLKPDDYLILLDERGKQLTSEETAAMVQRLGNMSLKSVVFLIGGAFGVSAAVTKRAGLIWSLSKMVMPHQLVRLVLAEQLYRACSILKNEKYHHS